MSIRPLQDRVVVRRMEEETKSAGEVLLSLALLQRSPLRVKYWR